MRLSQLYTLADISVNTLFNFEIRSVKLVLAEFHLRQLGPKDNFFLTDSFVREIKTFDDVSDVFLAVFGHIHHFIQKGMNSVFILFENVGHFYHPVAAVE
jgi:UDP-2,3-diacylglucosamine pyrophosphatase LpxH